MDLMLWFFLLGLILQGIKFLFNFLTDRYENGEESIFSIPEMEHQNLLSFSRKNADQQTKNRSQIHLRSKPEGLAYVSVNPSSKVVEAEGKEIFMHQSFDQSA